MTNHAPTDVRNALQLTLKLDKESLRIVNLVSLILVIKVNHGSLYGYIPTVSCSKIANNMIISWSMMLGSFGSTQDIQNILLVVTVCHVNCILNVGSLMMMIIFEFIH